MLHTSNDIRNPGLRTLPSGVERYYVRGGGLSVIEVSPEDNKEVFEATIFFKNINRDINKPGWGQSDILYRSERMELKN
jgi:hypothetical protein